MGPTLFFPTLPVWVAAGVPLTPILALQQRVLLVVRVEAAAHQAGVILHLQEVPEQQVRAMQAVPPFPLHLTVAVAAAAQAARVAMHHLTMVVWAETALQSTLLGLR